MRVRIRPPSLLAALLAVLLLAAGCAPTPSSKPAATGSAVDSVELPKGQPVTIEFWHIQATIYGEAIKEIVAAFNKKYEGQIVVKEVFKGSYQDLNKALRAAIQAGGLPHVSMAYESDILEYMKADVVIPLDPYISSARYGLKEEELDDIATGVLERQRLPQYKGKTMSWPHGNSALGAYYNIDLLKKAGYDKPPATWDEFAVMAKKVKDTTGVHGVVLAQNPWSLYKNMVRSYGVNPLSAEGKVNYNTPEALAALQVLKRMVLDEKSALLAANTEQEFTNGRAAVELSTTARTSSKIDLIKGKFQWGMTMLPQGKKDGKPITELYGGNQVMFKSDPQMQLASWIFLKYFAGPEAQAIYGARTGYFPATLSSRKSQLIQENYKQYPQKQQAFDEVFQNARIHDAHPAANEVNTLIGQAVESVLLGKATPEQALKDLQAKAEKAVKEMG